MKAKSVFIIVLGLVLIFFILLLTQGLSFPKIRAVGPESLSVVEGKDKVKVGNVQEAERLTLQITNLHAAYQRAGGENKPQALRTLQDATKQRKAHLIAIAEENPKEFLRIVLPKDMRDAFTLELKDDIESEISVEGSLEVFHEDDIENHEARFFHHINTQNGRLSLHSPKPFPQLISGKLVKVSGIKIENNIVITSFDERYFKVMD